MRFRRIIRLSPLIPSAIVVAGLWCWSAAHAQNPGSIAPTPEKHPASRESGTAAGSPHPAAETEDQGCETEPCPPAGGSASRILTLVDKTHAGISNRLEATVKYADRFFADENVFEETNKSYARLPLDIIYDQDDGLSFKIRVRARINLPNTDKKLKLLLSDTNSEEEPDNIAAPADDPLQDNNFSISLETQVKKTGKWKIRPSLGLKTNIPPDPFLRARVIRYFAVSKKWLSRFSTTGTYLAMAGAEFDARIQFSRALREDFLFRSTSRWKWTEEKDYSEGIQIFSLFQHLNEKVNLAYEGGIFSDNEDNWEVTEYRLWHRYRKLIYKDWLFLELIPELRFKQENDYDPTYRFTLRIEPVFGKDLPLSKIHRMD